MIIKQPPRLGSFAGIAPYVQSPLFSWMKSVASGLNGNLSFNDNFNSFVVRNVEIAAGATVNIDNQLGIIPNERYIVRQTGNGVITDGEWTRETLQLVNQGAETVVIDVRFFAVYEESNTGRAD